LQKRIPTDTVIQITGSECLAIRVDFPVAGMKQEADMMRIVLTSFKRKGNPLSRGEEQAILQKIIDLLYVEGLEFDLKIEEIESGDS